MNKIIDGDYAITILGRTGMLFSANKNEYYIDSEGLAGPDYGFLIYRTSVKLKKGNEHFKIDQDQQNEIISKVIEIFQRHSIYFEVI